MNYITQKTYNNTVWYVAIYMRLSREDGDKEESQSITNQRDFLIKFCHENPQFKIVNEYVDDGYSRN